MESAVERIATQSRDNGPHLAKFVEDEFKSAFEAAKPTVHAIQKIMQKVRV